MQVQMKNKLTSLQKVRLMIIAILKWLKRKILNGTVNVT